MLSYKKLILEKDIEIGNLLLEIGDIIYLPLTEEVGFELGSIRQTDKPEIQKFTMFNKNTDITSKIDDPTSYRNPLKFFNQSLQKFLQSTKSWQKVANIYDDSVKDVTAEYNKENDEVIITVTPDEKIGGEQHQHVVNKKELDNFRNIYGQEADTFLKTLKQYAANPNVGIKNSNAPTSYDKFK